MAGKKWSGDDIEFLKNNYENKSCEEIAKLICRSTRSVQHKFNELGLEHKKAAIGDIINGWKIVDIYNKSYKTQNITYAKIESVLGDESKRDEKLTKLTLHQVGWPDRRRPDLVIRNTTHNHSKSRLFRIWVGMKNRCFNLKQSSYKNYGGRGITICEDWLKFESFMNWANNNGYKDDLTIDRINVDGNYTPENCRWSNWIEQCSNKRNSIKLDFEAFGKKKSIYEWSRDERCIVNQSTLYYRINAGWNPEEAITKPSERKRKPSLKSWLMKKYPNIMKEYNNG